MAAGEHAMPHPKLFTADNSKDLCQRFCSKAASHSTERAFWQPFLSQLSQRMGENGHIRQEG